LIAIGGGFGRRAAAQANHFCVDSFNFVVRATSHGKKTACCEKFSTDKYAGLQCA
jgi:hypothetical protein